MKRIIRPIKDGEWEYRIEDSEGHLYSTETGGMCFSSDEEYWDGASGISFTRLGARISAWFAVRKVLRRQAHMAKEPEEVDLEG